MQITGYTIERELGYGGMSTVYLARHNSLDRHVAIKVMAQALAADRTFGERFLREGCTVAQLNHPHILNIYDIGEEGAYFYLATEYLSAGDLKTRIREGMEVEDVLLVMREIGSALSHAHAKCFVHRDIKPENILFREDDSAVLTDFGIAKVIGARTRMTKTGMLIGTPHYMSPEQARGLEVDHRSDLYSMGILFYEMLSGNVPYDAPETFAVGLKHINDPIPLLPEAFRRYQPILDHLLAKDPGNRYPDAASLLAALEQVADGRRLSRPSHAKKVTSAPAFSTSDSWKWGAGGALLALVIGLAGYRYLQQTEPWQMAVGAGGGTAVRTTVVQSDLTGSFSQVFPGMETVTPAQGSSTGILAVASSSDGAAFRRSGVTPTGGAEASLGRLWVKPEPSDAWVRILDIVLPYEDGIALPADSYTLEVSRFGYRTSTGTLELAAGQNLEVTVELEAVP